jgi:hypothetical protein
MWAQWWFFTIKKQPDPPDYHGTVIMPSPEITYIPEIKFNPFQGTAW